MIARVPIVIALVLLVSGVLPLRVVCAPGCCEQPAATPTCCAGQSEPESATCCGPSACCDAEPQGSGYERESNGCTGCGVGIQPEQGSSCLCVFGPMRPCERCDFLKLLVWAPWKESRENSETCGTVSAAGAVDMFVPRAEPVLRSSAPIRPPWRPAGSALLNRICVWTI